jgi:capsular exopolysaccharide synthesis family protein
MPQDKTEQRTAGPLANVAQSNGEWNGALSNPLPSASPALNLGIYIHALRRHWLMCLGIGMATAAIAGLAVWFGIGEQYTATGYLRVAMSEMPVLVQTDFGSSDRERFEIYKNTQRQLITSRYVLQAALRKPEMARIPDIEYEIKHRDPIEWLARWLNVGFPGRAEVMTVSFSMAKAEEAKTIVAAVVDAYLTEVVNAERERKRKRVTELETVCASKEQELRTKREELRGLGREANSMDTNTLNTKQQIALQELSLYRGELAKSQFEMQRLQGELAAQQALLKNVDMVDVPAAELDLLVQTDPVARQLGMELAWKKMDEVYTNNAAKPGVQSKYAERYGREVQMLQQQYDMRVAELRQKVQEKEKAKIASEILRLETMLASLQGQYENVQKNVAELQKRAEQFGFLTVDMEMLIADLQQQSLATAEMAGEREKLKVELRSPSRVESLGEVELPLVPSNTTFRIAVTFFTALLGLVCPAIAVVLLDTRNRRINTAEDVSKGLRLPVIGSVPRIPAQVIRHLASPGKRHRSWHLRLTESVDGIAARLLHKAEHQQCKVVMVSSAAGGEGKTTLATQLAMSLARTGRRTVLVDFDLRRPSFDEVFGKPLAPGVSELLRKQSAIVDLIHETAAENLWVVTAGHWDRTALAALSNGSAAEMFKQFREQFDFVIVDTSPILPVADARFVSQLADAVVLSVFRDVSEAPKIQAACDILAAFGAQSVEAVVTGSEDYTYGNHMGYESTVTA